MKKMGHVGLRRTFTLKSLAQNKQDDSVTIAKLTKEKDDLQEINEKMLDLIKEKEVFLVLEIIIYLIIKIQKIKKEIQNLILIFIAMMNLKKEILFQIKTLIRLQKFLHK